ncbi:hypothetical protein LIER_31789 [Lithospermum erythrorhizon]|uniref:Uncharacterized protein n=1 Tax=Lithospermum erythrorhizon TaxID=34254 RepID=A0AAV3RXB3_LITER
MVSLINLQEALEKDLEERGSESGENDNAFLANAYLHPIFHSFEEVELEEVKVHKHQTLPVHSPTVSERSSPSPPPHDLEHHDHEDVHQHPRDPD